MASFHANMVTIYEGLRQGIKRDKAAGLCDFQTAGYILVKAVAKWKRHQTLRAVEVRNEALRRPQA